MPNIGATSNRAKILSPGLSWRTSRLRKPQTTDCSEKIPTDLEYQFKEQLDQYEQDQMPYITSIERMRIEKGREEERKEIAKRLLSQGVPVEMIAQATDFTLEQIQLIQVDQER
jgi:hypothetical protein